MNALLQVGLSNGVACGIMAVVLLPLTRMLRRPALTHALSVMILLKLVTPPLFNFPVNWNAGEESARAKGECAEEARPPRGDSIPLVISAEATNEELTASAGNGATIESVPELKTVLPVARTTPHPTRPLNIELWNNVADHWRTWLLIAWVAIAMLLGAWTLVRIIRLDWAIKSATLPGPNIVSDVELLSSRLGIRRIPPVRFIAGSSPPMLLALFHRPELVIPLQLWDRLDRSQQQTLLLHELAHLRRGDHWVRYLEILATSVYWWHPATWLARSTLREAEEQCCDAWVIWAMPKFSQAYMSTLLDVIDFVSQSSRPRIMATDGLASGMGQFHNLQRRFTMVRQRNVQRRLTGRGLTAVLLFSAIVLPVGTKLVRGDDQPSVQGNSSALPRDNSSFTGPEEHPRNTRNEASKLAVGADPQNLKPNNASQSQDEAIRLETELQATLRNVDRIRRQLDRLKRKSIPPADAGPKTVENSPLGPSGFSQAGFDAIAAPRTESQGTAASRRSSREARLGHIVFRYQDDGSDGTVHAFDLGSKKLLWTLKMPLNAESIISCYDNESLLIKSADGYTRLVTVEDGHVTRAWAPGVEAPPASTDYAVNPYRISDAHPSDGKRASPGAFSSLDQEKRMERMEESIRALTDAVNRLERAQKEQQSPSPPQSK